MTARRELRVTEGGPPLAVDVFSYDTDAPRGAVLCVHGFASGRRGDKIACLGAALPPRGWTVLALDQQGHGDSGGDFESLTVGRSMDDVRRVAALPEFADAPRRIIVGSSFGGLVSAWLAAESPGICDALLLIAPAFGFLDRYLPTLPAGEREAWEAGRPHRIEMDHRVVHIGADILRERERRPLDRLARELRTPTLIVHGTRDESVPHEASEDFARRAARDDLEVVLIDGADHRLADHLDMLASIATRFASAIESPESRANN